MYDLNSEPGHAELVASVVHVDLKEYQVGAAHYEKLHQQIQERQRFNGPEEFMVNL